MPVFIRQCCGVDVSKDTLDVVISVMDDQFNYSLSAASQFKNNQKAIKQLLRWITKHQQKHLPLQVVLEATGVYHQLLCYTLYDNGFDVSVVMPNKISSYAKSTDVRTITDKISARHIAAFGLSKKLDSWQKPHPALSKLKALSREREQLLDQRTIAKNQAHAKEYTSLLGENSQKRNQQHILFLSKQIKEVEKDIQGIIKENAWLKEKLDNICSIDGVGMITAITIVSETDGFQLFRSSRQLVCFAGYDIVEKQSGTSVKAKTHISHKGNKHIRKALYFPSLTAAKKGVFKEQYERLFEKHRIKMKSYVAVQRKLLVLIYTLWKKDEKYDASKHTAHKYLEQTQRTALTELELVRS